MRLLLLAIRLIQAPVDTLKTTVRPDSAPGYCNIVDNFGGRNGGINRHILKILQKDIQFTSIIRFGTIFVRINCVCEPFQKGP